MANTGNAATSRVEGPELGSNLKPGTGGGAGIRNSLGWVGVSLVGIKGGAAGLDQLDILDLRIYGRFRNRT